MFLRIGAASSENPGHPYSLKDELVRYNKRIVISPTSPLVQQLLHEHQNTTMRGHSGILRTFKHLSRQFYWPSIHKFVATYVAQCDTCQ